MREKLSIKFNKALNDKAAMIERHKKELLTLKRLAEASENLPIYTSAEVNSKNAQKQFMCSTIICTFGKIANGRRTKTLPTEIRLTTDKLWRQLILPSDPRRANARFRGYLHSLKQDGVLIQDKEKWKLTELGHSFLCAQEHVNE